MNVLQTTAAVALAATLCACSQSPKDDATPAQDAEKAVRIATESSFKPFSYTDNQGNLVGFEIDLANALCEQMQARCEIVSYDWDGLIPSLNANRFDAIMAGMSITDERRQVVDFGDPYFYNALVLVAKKDKPISIQDVDNKNVAVQQATLSAQYLEKNHPKAVVKAYDKQDNAYLDLIAGRADFMLSDMVPALDWLKTDNGAAFEIKGEPIDIDDQVAVAFRKGDDKTREDFNRALSALKANGVYDTLVAKYFDQSALALAANRDDAKGEGNP